MLHDSCGLCQAKGACVPVGGNGGDGQGLGGNEVISPSSEKLHGAVERDGPLELRDLGSSPDCTT